MTIRSQTNYTKANFAGTSHPLCDYLIGISSVKYRLERHIVFRRRAMPAYGVQCKLLPSSN